MSSHQSYLTAIGGGGPRTKACETRTGRVEKGLRKTFRPPHHALPEGLCSFLLARSRGPTCWAVTTWRLRNAKELLGAPAEYLPTGRKMDLGTSMNRYSLERSSFSSSSFLRLFRCSTVACCCIPGVRSEKSWWKFIQLGDFFIRILSCWYSGVK